MSARSFVESEQKLHDDAVAQTGLDDFGDADYLDGLRRVLDAYDNDAAFSESGRQTAYFSLVDILAKRLRTEKLLHERPEIGEIEIKRPIVITGLVRTGSTALHHLMGHDPERQAVEYWLGCHPQPRPPRDTWESREQYQGCVAELEAMYSMDPSLRQIHVMMADGPEECRHFLAQNFRDDFFQVTSTVPSYNDWYEATDMTSTYRRHKQLLQLIGSTEAEKQWILKYPVHMKNLETLLNIYPDARIIWTHRDPSKVLSSYISLVASFRGIFEDNVDRDEVAREQIEIWAGAAGRATELRKNYDAVQFYDLHFRDFVEDPVGAVAKIHAYFKQPFNDRSRNALEAWVESNPKGKHGAHDHSMDRVRLSREAVLERFSNYMNALGVEAE